MPLLISIDGVRRSVWTIAGEARRALNGIGAEAGFFKPRILGPQG
jgi:hypothetical protein